MSQKLRGLTTVAIMQETRRKEKRSMSVTGARKQAKALKMKLNMTQKELAKILNITQPSVCYWSKKGFTKEQIKQIDEYLNEMEKEC